MADDLGWEAVTFVEVGSHESLTLAWILGHSKVNVTMPTRPSRQRSAPYRRERYAKQSAGEHLVAAELSVTRVFDKANHQLAPMQRGGSPY